jgi:hypothetical protein
MLAFRYRNDIPAILVVQKVQEGIVHLTEEYAVID